MPAEQQQQFCNSCRLTEVAPDLSDTNNRIAWAGIEAAKRRLLYTLYALKLPLSSRQEWPNEGVAFHFLRGTNDEPVMTGHDEGIITLNIAEADSAFRENMREKMGEAYRTVLGHLRHEIGHYYWDRLIRNSNLLAIIPRVVRRRVARLRAGRAASLRAGCARELVGFVHQRLRHDASLGRLGRNLGALPAHGRYARNREEPRSYLARSRGAERSGEQMSTDALAFRDFESLTSSWNAVTLALNSLNRSMGMKDAYPFVLSPKVLEKLRFVHELIQSRRAEQKAGESSRDRLRYPSAARARRGLPMRRLIFLVLSAGCGSRRRRFQTQLARNTSSGPAST